MRVVALEALSRAVAYTLLVGRAVCQIAAPGAESLPLDRISPQVEEQIRALKQDSTQLAAAVKLFEAHLDDAIARYDSASSNSSPAAADADLGGVRSAGTKRQAVRKLMIARMLASRTPESVSPGLADLDRLQELIAETRQQIDAAEGLLKSLLVVSAGELKQGKGGQRTARHDQLLKARNGAEQAASRAVLVLPVDLPEAELTEESDGLAVNLLAGGNNLSLGKPRNSQSQPDSSPLRYSLNWERNRRITLVHENGYCVAITDPGRLDSQGRHLFYQEEWVQRGETIVRRRWRVAVDTTSGQHVLVKRYPSLEYRGNFEDAYRALEKDRLWRLEPPDGSAEPASADVESAIDRVARARQELHQSLGGYAAAVGDALRANDRMLEAEGRPQPDKTLGLDLRQKLFAIRGHLAGAAVIVRAEMRVNQQADRLAEEVQSLESLAAWGNRATLDPRDPPTRLTLPEWDLLQARAGAEIGLASNARDGVRAALPPDLSQALGKFPALQDNLIVHLLRQPPDYSNPQYPGAVRCLQEVWQFVPGDRKNGRQVQRIVTLIALEPNSGRQTVVINGGRYYDVGPDDLLEAIFDQYGGQDVPLASNGSSPLPAVR